MTPQISSSSVRGSESGVLTILLSKEQVCNYVVGFAGPSVPIKLLQPPLFLATFSHPTIHDLFKQTVVHLSKGHEVGGYRSLSIVLYSNSTLQANGSANGTTKEKVSGGGVQAIRDFREQVKRILVAKLMFRSNWSNTERSRRVASLVWTCPP